MTEKKRNSKNAPIPDPAAGGKKAWKKPTERQKEAFKHYTDNGGNASKALKAAGYGETIVKNPQKVTQSKGWQFLVDKYLPEEKLAKVHSEGLEAKKTEHKVVGKDENGQPVYDFVEVPDYATRHKYLDTAYKITRKYDEDANKNVLNVIGNDALERIFQRKQA